MKKGLLILSMIFALALATGCGCAKKDKTEPKVNVNTNKGVIEDKKVDSIEFTKTSLVTVDGVSTLETKVTNNTKEDYQLNAYKIIFKDKDGKEIYSMPGYVGTKIKAGETKYIKSTTNYDVSSAYSVEYEVKK